VVASRFIDKRPLIHQPRAQFILDLSFFLAAGFLSISINNFVHNVPFTNGLVFLVGFLAFGFFIAVDMSLQRERSVIACAMKQSANHTISKHFYPLTRKFFIVALTTNLLMMVIIMLIIGRDLVWLAQTDISSMNLVIPSTTKTIFQEILLVVTTLFIQVTNILFSYSQNLKLLFQTETGVLVSVTQGDLSKLVPVATRDEFGMIAGYTNKMIHGLRDRIRMLTRLNMAKKFQENLLPAQAPEFKGLDISGTCLFCEEVGGDYYDFFQFSKTKIGMVVTDSSGHGMGAGLHMTTIRAFLRYGIDNYTTPLDLIRSVNRHLTRDSRESGRFTTVFFVDIDMETQTLKWIRAGHEPGLLFKPNDSDVEKLMGNGMALGVDTEALIEENEIRGWETGTVLLIASDGIKESRNLEGEMYGEEKMIKVVQMHKTEPAQIIEARLIEDLQLFTGNTAPEDDITMVIVKFV